MVCQRCVKVVKEELEKEGLKVESVALGKAIVAGNIEKKKLEEIRNILLKNGFELLDEKREQVVEQVKNLIIDLIHYGKEKPESVNYSEYISKELHYDYNYLSSLFSSVENITIEKFIILQKIEKAKELLVYDQLSLSEIAFKMNYSSTAHLSRQFKSVTGLTPTEFKEQAGNNRKFLDKVTP